MDQSNDSRTESSLLFKDHIVLLDPETDLPSLSSQNVDLLQDAGYSDETSNLDSDKANENVQKAKERAKVFINRMEHESLENIILENSIEIDHGNIKTKEPNTGCDITEEGTRMVLENLCFNIYENSGFNDDRITNADDSRDNDTHNTDVWSSNQFDSLPYEIIQNIMCYLNQYDLCHSVACVSKKWMEYAYDPIYWTCLNFDAKYCLSSYVLASVLKRASLLKKLCLYAQCIDHLDMLYISQNCPLLQDLDLGFVSTVDEQFITVVSQHCQNLQYLNVEGCIQINPNCISILCQEGKVTKLKGLNVSHCTKLTDESVITLAKSKAQLEMLNVDGISWLTDRTIQELCSLRGTTLKILYLDGAELSVDSVHSIVENCTQLEKLSWSFAELLTDSSVLLIKDISTLKELTIKKGVDFSSESIQAMFQDGELCHLRKLDLSECTQIRDECVAAITNCCASSLTNLSLCWCWNITEKGLQYIVNKCRNIKDLNLLGIDKITGECLIDVDSKMPKLKFLNLNQCNKINDALIIDILRKKPDLRAINYYGEDFRTCNFENETI